MLHGRRAGRIEARIVGARADHLDGPPHGLRSAAGTQ
jgi:hypothetical protein